MGERAERAPFTAHGESLGEGGARCDPCPRTCRRRQSGSRSPDRPCLARLGAALDILRFLKGEPYVWSEVAAPPSPNQNDREAELAGPCERFAAERGPEPLYPFAPRHPDFELRASLPLHERA